MLEKIFHLKENHTDVKTEVMAGITTFMTMAYILAVNPSILSASGMDANAVLIATSLASFVGTALMALLANYPFALAPGMGLNAYFSYTVVLTMGYSWQLALMAVFVEGIIFIVLSLTNVREAIFNAIPMTLKSAVSVGIGLFVAFVGLQNAKLIVNSDSTLVTYQHFKGETFHSIGVGAILALVGVLITAILLVKKVKGGILYGILITWVLGILCEIAGIYVPNPDAGMYSVIPTAFVSFDFSALGKTFGQVFKTDFSGVGILNFFAVMFSFLFVDLFDTLGTLIGVAPKADMLDEEGKRLLEATMEAKEVSRVLVPQLMALGQADVSRILTRVIRKARDGQWNSVDLLRCLNCTEAHPELGEQFVQALEEIPPGSRPYAILPKLKSKPWAALLLADWRDDPESAEQVKTYLKSSKAGN